MPSIMLFVLNVTEEWTCMHKLNPSSLNHEKKVTVRFGWLVSVDFKYEELLV